MKDHNGSPNPSEAGRGDETGAEAIMVETVANDDDDHGVQAYSTSPSSQAEEKEDTQVEAGSLAAPTGGEEPTLLPTWNSSTSRDQPVNIGQAFPSLWETGPLDNKVSGKKSTTSSKNDESSQGKSQTIEFDDSEPLKRNPRRSTDTIQDLIDQARRQSASTFQSPPTLERVTRMTRPETPHSFPNITPLVSNPEARAFIRNPNQDPDPSDGSSSSSDSLPDLDDGDEDPPELLDRNKVEYNDSDSEDEDEDENPYVRMRGQCTNCNFIGHTAEQCTRPPRNRQVPQPRAPSARSPTLTCGHCGLTHATHRCPSTTGRGLREGGLLVDGRRLRLRRNPAPINTYQRKRNWNKLLRWSLTTEERLAFEQKASGYVLGKNNKLRVQSQLTEDDDILKNMHNLYHQVKALKAHVIEYDMMDVFTIVVPRDIQNSPETRRETYNLFDDYPKLTPEIVGNSDAYYSRWIADDYIPENLNLTYTLVKNNTDERLFNKCLELYDQFHPMQQGGPLILCIILQKVHNASEQHLEHLKDKVERLKIKDIEGENVETAVSLINTAYSIFLSSSTPTYNRVPPEWSKTLIMVFQTTSVPEFNETFKDEERVARREADKNGGQPLWPTHEQLTRLATVVYNRIKASGYWDIPKGRKVKGYLGNGTSCSTPAPPSPTNMDYECWNCGARDHKLVDCPKPRNQPRIDNKRAEFRARRGNNHKKKRHDRQPKRKTIDGRPHILNKKGAYVLDQKQARERKKEKIQQALIAEADNPESAPPAPVAHHQAAPRAPIPYDPYTVQSLLRELL